MEKMSKKELMTFIQSTNFTVIELALYLDTHPNCPCGLSAYEEKNRELMRAVKIYERNYGPLTLYGNKSDINWTWAEKPWPWQKGCDC